MTSCTTQVFCSARRHQSESESESSRAVLHARALPTTSLSSSLSDEEEEEELDKNFIESIGKVIPAKKTLLLLRAEYEFKKQLLKQYRHKKG